MWTSIERHMFVQCTSWAQEVEVFLDNLRGTARLSITQNERWLNYKGIQGNLIQYTKIQVTNQSVLIQLDYRFL